MALNHQEAVKKLAYQFRSKTTTTKVYAHRIDRFDDPPVRVGKHDHIPDLVVEFSNGHEKLIEVDTGSSLTGGEKEQHQAFKRSANHVSNRPMSTCSHRTCDQQRAEGGLSRPQQPISKWNLR